MEFYKQLADSYDLMTRFEERFQNEKEILQKWQQKLQFKSALDVACGTGLHAILFAQMGIQTAGTDISAEMLQKAEENARQKNVSVSWIKTSMQDLQQHVAQKFDVVFCLGNSIPHILTNEDLNQSLTNFYQFLNPNGYLILQLLNYERILKQKERIVGIHRKGNMEFVRFYDFLHNRIRFNILKITDQNEKLSYDLSQTELFPYCKNDLETKLSEAGFTKLQFLGNMKMQNFVFNSSPNLVVLAKK